MLVPIQMGTNMAAGNQQKHLLLSFATKAYIYPRGGGGHSQKNLVGVCGPLPKDPTLFMTKIYDIPYPIYDLTKNSKPYL